ncbi:FkbM family methyltransferase [Rhodobacteraceae bacterium 2376]|uniref:FkbM family methyltransferase n=1 Tax=Rhabdonatronobacter sediminivivens TaxID=2743469 RepID=A0A7Z0I256_9RHOB|nr:FkbM family methyltransferase [Rhabdonatronobacter sediminivivens]NYS26551.1 FkbM family methyltransferase [Rhabdonatronobacter sediminivivens]
MLREIKTGKPTNDFLFLDIGANRGQTISSIRLFQNSRIVSIEPLPWLHKSLVERFKDDKNLKIKNFFVSENTHDVTIHVPSYNGVLFDGLASGSPQEASGFFEPNKFLFFDRRKLELKKFEVPSKPLDEFDLAPDFMKVDVQGFELSVLRGARKTIEKYQPIIVLERPKKDEEVAFLEEYGYRPWKYKKGAFTPGLGANNIFFLCDHHHSMFSSRFES